MKFQCIFIATLIAIIPHLTEGVSAFAQSNVESLRDLMRQQATEKAENGRIANVETFISKETERSLIRARQSGASGNIQIRRGDTSGVDQDQLGEGNRQSISVGSDH